MKEILTAKEWVDKYNEETDSQYSDYDCNYPMMEQYADYRTKELENKIVEFRNKFKDVAMLRRIDEHFNIK